MKIKQIIYTESNVQLHLSSETLQKRFLYESSIIIKLLTKFRDVFRVLSNIQDRALYKIAIFAKSSIS